MIAPSDSPPTVSSKTSDEGFPDCGVILFHYILSQHKTL